MTKVVFETSTIADCVRKADAIAPRRGSGFDKAAGIVIQITPGEDGNVVVMATDTDIFYMEVVGAISIEGEQATWRVPSQVFASILGNLPSGNASTVTMDDSLEKNRIQITSGRTKAKINSLDHKYYPFWDPFKTDDIITVSDLGSVIQRVQWACSASDGSLKSIFLTKTSIFATDRYKVARIKLDTSIPEPVVVPCFQLGKVLPRNGDIKVSGSGKIFVAAPDNYTQIATTTVEIPIPPIDKILDYEYKYLSSFNKTHFLAMLNRALAFSSGDRQSVVTLITGKGDIAVMVDDQEVGLFGDVCEISGDAESHKRMKVKVGPAQLRDAVNSVPSETVSMRYNDPGDAPRLLKFDDGSGKYSCAITLSKGDEKKSEDED